MLVAGIGLTVLCFLICIIGKMSANSSIYLAGTYAVVFSMGYFGAIVAVPIFMAAFFYFSSSLLNFLNSFR
jgi:hypothetical protein